MEIPILARRHLYIKKTFWWIFVRRIKLVFAFRIIAPFPPNWQLQSFLVTVEVTDPFALIPWLILVGSCLKKNKSRLFPHPHSKFLLSPWNPNPTTAPTSIPVPVGSQQPYSADHWMHSGLFRPIPCHARSPEQFLWNRPQAWIEAQCLAP